jgi:hypothetical protein
MTDTARCYTIFVKINRSHKAHRRALSRLADRLGIRGIVLLTFDERLHVSRRDQPDRVPEPADLARPVVGAAAGLHRHHAGPLGREEGKNLVPPQLLAEQDCSRRIGAVHLEHALRQIHPDCANFSHGRLPQVVLINTSTVAH